MVNNAGVQTRFRGDLLDTPLVKAAHALCRDVGPLAPELVRLVEDELATTEAHLRPAPALGEGRPLREFVSAVQRDLDDFRKSSGAHRVIVVNVATTEAPPASALLGLDLADLERMLDVPAASLPTSALYAYAAMDMGVPYVNFTPSVGASLPGLEALADARGVPHAGRDGKTGETLLKSALAPMFRMRNLQVRSWVGWHRHVTLSLFALAVVAVIRSRTAKPARRKKGAPA